MVQLVADGAGQELLGLHLPLIHIQVLVADDHAVGPGHDPHLLRDREAALVSGLLPVRLNDLGVDHGIGLALVLRDIDDHQPLEDADLGGREPHSARLIHGLQHIPGQIPDPGGHLLDGLRFFLQNGVSHFSDRT